MYGKFWMKFCDLKGPPRPPSFKENYQIILWKEMGSVSIWVWFLVHNNIFQDFWKVVELAHRLFPSISDDYCDNFWRHKPFIIDPSIMRKHGITVTRIVQHPGQAVITMPNAFHCGFNLGFNIAAAINFAAPGWVIFLSVKRRSRNDVWDRLNPFL